jgi:hypothetical protein
MFVLVVLDDWSGASEDAVETVFSMFVMPAFFSFFRWMYWQGDVVYKTLPPPGSTEEEQLLLRENWAYGWRAFTVFLKYFFGRSIGTRARLHSSDEEEWWNKMQLKEAFTKLERSGEEWFWVMVIIGVWGIWNFVNAQFETGQDQVILEFTASFWGLIALFSFWRWRYWQRIYLIQAKARAKVLSEIYGLPKSSASRDPH